MSASRRRSGAVAPLLRGNWNCRDRVRLVGGRSKLHTPEVSESSERYPDQTVAELSRLFGEHRAWLEASSRVSESSSSNVYFRHRPGEVWRLARRGGRTRLEAGSATDPDFVFRFSTGAVRRLASVAGGIDEFAVELFSLFAEADELRIDFRVVAPLRRLVRRGYLRLLLEAGPKVALFAARQGVGGLRVLRTLVARSRSKGPFEWEIPSDRSGR